MLRTESGSPRPVARTPAPRHAPEPAKAAETKPARSPSSAQRAEVDPKRQAGARAVTRHDETAAARRISSTSGSTSGDVCSPGLKSDYLNPSYVDRVVNMKDPVQRNYAITRGYHELSEGMSALTGRDNANWLTYGKWASNTAGSAIRKEVDMKAPGEGIPLLGHVVGGGRNILDGHFKGKAANAVARGNQEIFKDIGPHFSRFVTTFQNDESWKGNPRRGQKMLDGFLADPKLQGEGKKDMRDGFTAYYQAMQLKDSKAPADVEKRAQLMLKGNVLVAQHEQHVADKFVRDAMPGKTLNDNITDQMRMNIPTASLILGKDIPKPSYLGGKQFPDDLKSLPTGPGSVDEMRQHYKQHNGDTKESAVGDWSHYNDRMGFIFQYFRAYQQDRSLQSAPANLPVVRP